jgi:site-specific DNA-methyltransferase (adenine-specific)
VTYEGNGWKVIQGRWQDTPPDSVDHVISDPPYDEKTHAGGRRGGTDRSAYKGGISHAHVFSFPPIDPAVIAPRLLEVARRWVLCFCSVEQIGHYAAAAGAAWVRGGIYVKSNPTPQFTGDRPAVWGDGIAIMHRKGRKRWNGGGIAGCWTAARGERDDRVHETQKDLSLMLELVRLFTDPGDLVWDPYGGSMTTGVACLMLGRRFLGHEMQAHYAEAGAERLRAAEQGQTLTAYRAGQISLFGGAK